MTRSREIGRSAANNLMIVLVAIVTASIILLGIWGIGMIEFSGSDTSQSGEVSITEGVTYLDRSGQPTIVGEISNGLDTTIHNVTISISGGDVTSEGTPIVTTIPSGMSIPFELKLDERLESSLEMIEVDYETGGTYTTDLQVNQVEETYRGPDSVSLVGSIEYTGSEDLDRPIVIVKFYNDQGELIGVRSDRISASSFVADDTAYFSVRYSTVGHLPSHARTYATYDVIVIDAG